MINYLKDIKKETLIGLLPDVINSNNESIRKEFNWIFDSSLNRLIKSVYAPTGSVKAHFGEFTNLACEYFTVKNVDSLKYSILDSVESIINETLNVSSMQIVMAALTNIANSSFIDPKQYDISALCDISTLIVNHNVLNNRFKDADFIDDDQQDFCHDAAAIIYKKDKNNRYITVELALDTVSISDSSIDELKDEIQNCNTSLNNVITEIENCNASIENIKLVNQQQNVVIQNLNVSTLQQDTSIKRLFTQNNILNDSVILLNTSINRINTSINKINTSINNLSNDIINLEERNSNNLIYDEITIVKNQYNFIATPISDDATTIEIKFEDEDINHEYNFKFILNSNVAEVYIYNDEWHSADGNKILYINCDNNTYHIDYNEGSRLFKIKRDEDRNSAMCDITLNRYVDADETTICMLLCKVYELYVPECI